MVFDFTPTYYRKIVQDIFGTAFEHPTLRTLFDQNSSEWDMTTMDKKIEILQKIIADGRLSFSTLIMQYKSYYFYEAINRAYIAEAAEEGAYILMNELIKRSLSEDKTK